MERLSPTRATELAASLLNNIERVFHGKAEVALRVVVSLVARGHVPFARPPEPPPPEGESAQVEEDDGQR